MKLHLGCGKRFLKGYTHIDLADYKHIDYRRDVKTLSWFDDEIVELIYASHVIEYFDLDEVVGVLKEWRRVLRKGGILRLAVPDLKALCHVYMLYEEIDFVRGPLYGSWAIPGPKKNIYHRTVWDFVSLGIMLKETGFKNIRRWDWRKVFVGEHEGFDDYSQPYIPHMDKENGILISLNVEAEK